MSLEPQASAEVTLAPLQEAKAPATWYRKLAALLVAVICFEIGLFLLVFPWLRSWDLNSLAHLSPAVARIWSNSFFRGGVSGLGLVNIFISFGEVFRLRRFSAY